LEDSEIFQNVLDIIYIGVCLSYLW